MSAGARRARRRRSAAAALAVAAVALAAAGCGKKGPPLPPFAKAPAAPASPSARRLGNIVEIRFTVPVVDLDGQRPANLDRIEVWALTGQVSDPALFLEYATLVGTVPVRPPPPPPPDVKEGEPPPPPPPPSTEPGLDQGQPGLVVDELTPEDLTPVVVPEIEKQKARDLEARQELLARLGPLTLTPPDLGTPLPSPLMRYYVVMGRNGGRKGAMSPRLAVPLREPPPAPPAPTAVAAESYVELTWTAPPNLRQPVHKGTAVAPPPAAPGRPGARTPAAPGGAAPPAGTPLPPSADDEDTFDDDQLQLRAQPPPAAEPGAILAAPPQPAAPAAPPAPAAPEAAAAPAPAAAGPPAGAAPAPGETAAPATPPVLNSRTLTGLPAFVNGYVVYEVPRPGTPAPDLQPGQEAPLPRRATPAPIAATTWRDDKVAFGSERCYQVRTVETSGTPIESEPSEVLCVSPTDTFPPKAPASLAAVGSQGAVNLIWNANTEPDLAGYLVLRGRAGGGALRPLTPKPITQTTYRDDTVEPGTRYVYAVVAVDTATPPNMSPESNRVEETAR